MFLAKLADHRHIDQFQTGIRGRFDVHHLGVGLHGGLPVGLGGRGVEVGVGDVPLAQDLRDNLVRRAKQRPTGDKVVTRLQNGRKTSEYRRHTRGRGHAILTVFQHTNLIHKLLHGRIGKTAVQISLLSFVKERFALLGGFKGETAG